MSFRITRATLGQTLKSMGTLIDPERQIGHTTFNKAWSKVAAGTLVQPLCWVLINGTTGAYVAGGEIWNPTSDAALRPTVARTGAGIYTVTLAATYLDETGAACAVAPVGGKPSPQTTNVDRSAVANVPVGTLVCTIKTVVDSTKAAVDCDVLVEIF